MSDIQKNTILDETTWKSKKEKLYIKSMVLEHKDFYSMMIDDVVVTEEQKIDNSIKIYLFEEYLNKNKKSNKLEWIDKYLQCKNIYQSTLINKEYTNGYYVYALIDHTNGEIFYIGKGKGNRLYQHEKEQNETEKIKRINKIGSDNIHYWLIDNNLENGMALSLESYLINKLPKLTNILIPDITFEYCIYLDYLTLINEKIINEQSTK